MLGFPIASYAIAAPTPAASTAPAPTSTVASVTLTPAATTLAAGATQQFTWAIAGANSPSQAVDLSTTAGEIDASGLFTGPAATDAEQVIVVTATSVQDPSKSATAVVTIEASAGQDPGPGQGGSGQVAPPSPTAADINLFTIMQMSTINVQATLGPAAINLTVSLS